MPWMIMQSIPLFIEWGLKKKPYYLQISWPIAQNLTCQIN